MKPTNEEIIAKGDEVYARNNTSHQQDRIDLANWAVDRALEGMVPAGELINLDWPDGATSVDLLFYACEAPIRPSQSIRRPKPAWAPKAGQDVWALHVNGNEFALRTWGEDTCVLSSYIWIAEATSIEEKHWELDQFKARGEYWINEYIS